MKITSTTVIDAPRDAVFGDLADIARIEREALARGIQVERLDDLGVPGPGMRWRVKFPYRGRTRSAESELTVFEPPRQLRLEGRTGGLRFETDFVFSNAGHGRTEVTMVSDLSASSVAGKLALSSLRLARGTAQQRLDKRLAAAGKSCAARLGQTDGEA